MVKQTRMRKLIQTRFGDFDYDQNEAVDTRDNSYATVIACFLNLNSPEDCLQIQEYFTEKENDAVWLLMLGLWLEERGYDWGSLDGHKYDNSYYIVVGESLRGTTHACIYKNGELWHDPHPDNTGLLSEEFYEYVTPLTTIFQ